MALRDGEVAHRIRFYPERVRSGGGSAFEPQRSARPALSHRASVPHRSRRSDPEHLQFRDARSAAGSGRRENSFAGRNETFETIIRDAFTAEIAEITKSKRRITLFGT